MSGLVPDDRLALRVGAIALCVLGAAIAASVFLVGHVALGAPTRIRVVFRTAAGLREQAPLVVAGQPVGRVEAIVPVPHGAPGLLAGEVGIAATVALDRASAWKVPAAAEIFVASRGPLSDKYLEVAPPTGDPGPAVREGQELRGVDPPSLDNVLQHTWVNITVFKLFIDTVRPELDAVVHQIAELRRQLDGLAGAGEVGAAIAAAGALVRSARHTHDGALGGEPGLAALGATVGQARETVAQLRAAIDVLGPRADAFAANLGRVRGQLAAADPVERSRRAFAQLRAALDKIDPLLAMIDELGDRIARGEGSLGRLMTDPEFSDDARDLGKVMKRHPWKFLERPKD